MLKIWHDTLAPTGKYSQKRIMVFSCFWLAVVWGSFQQWVWYQTGQEPNYELVLFALGAAVLGAGINVYDKTRAKQIN